MRRHVLTGLAASGASSNRTIALAFIDVEYRNRLEPEDVVATLAALDWRGPSSETTAAFAKVRP
jgi:hypothetical protein